MKQLLAVLVICVSLFSTQFASADFYIGAGAYSASIDESEQGLKFDEDDVVPGLFLGWKPIEMFIIEVGYYDLGDYSKNYLNRKAEFDAYALTVALVGNLPLSIIDLYAKIGGSYVDFDLKVDNIKDADSSTELFGGVGGAVNLGNHVDLYAEYLIFDSEIQVDMWGAGVRLEF